jgi:hypothetical protein
MILEFDSRVLSAQSRGSQFFFPCAPLKIFHKFYVPLPEHVQTNFTKFGYEYIFFNNLLYVIQCIKFKGLKIYASYLV